MAQRKLPGVAHKAAEDHGITPENRSYMWSRLWENETFGQVVAYMQKQDGLLDSDWLKPDTKAGFGRAQMGVQDGHSALLANQLIEASVEEIGQHIKEARNLVHPAARILQGSEYEEGRRYEEQRDAEIESAVRRNVERGEAGPRLVLREVSTILALAESLKPLSKKLREEMSPPHIRCTPFDHVNPAFSAAVIAALNDKDHDMPLRQLMGAPVVGDLPPTYSWDPRFKPRSLGMDFDDLPHADWNRWLHQDISERARSTQGATDAEAVWAKTKQEIDKGLCDGPFEFKDVEAMYGPQGFRACRRFGVWQNGEIRVCDNEKESLANAGSTEHDKLRTQSPDWSVRAAARFARHMGQKRGWTLEHGTDDIDAAYRRVLNATPGFTIAAFFNPEVQRTQYVVLHGFNFGLVSAVIYFNAVPALAAKAARRILGIVCDHYFDDFDTLALRGQGRAYQSALGHLMTAFGYPFAAKKHKPAAISNPFLGVITDFTRLEKEGVVEVGVSEDRRSKIVLMCDAARLKLLPPEAETLVGKVGWTLQWCFGKIGRAALQPLHVRARQGKSSNGAPTPAIQRAIRFIKEVIKTLPRREILLEKPVRPSVLIWSDAAYARRAKVGTGGFVALFPAEGPTQPEEVYFAQDKTDPKVMRKFHRREQYIGQLEICYAVTPYWTLGEKLKGRQVIHFIDNTSACAALVKGYASCIDSGLLVNAFHAFNAGLRADVFFEYVRSAANIADLPSRLAMNELWKVLEENGLAKNAKELEMRMPDFDDWTGPVRALVEAGIGASFRQPLVKKVPSEAEAIAGREMLQPKRRSTPAAVAPVIAKRKLKTQARPRSKRSADWHRRALQEYKRSQQGK